VSELSWQNRIVKRTREKVGNFAHNECNPKIHGETQKERLGAVLEKFGQVGEIYVWQSERNGGKWTIFDGHAREALDPEQEWDIAYTTLTDAEVDELVLYYDPLAAMAQTDREKLGALMQSISVTDARLTSMLAEMAEREGVYFGGNGKPAEDAGPQIDKASELQEVWQVCQGDVWEIASKTAQGVHRIVCGDCTDAATVERVMQGERAALVATDPPFAVTGSATGSDDMSGINIMQPFFRMWLSLAVKLMPDFAHVYICCDWRTYPMVDGAAHQVGLYPKNCIVWFKGGGGLGSMYQNTHEFIWFGTKQPPKRVKFNKTGQRLVVGDSNLWQYTPPTYASGEHRVEHTANKPLEMFERIIKNSSDGGMVVYDPFLGSGTTMVAAERLSRFCRGIEIEPKYVSVSLQRLADMGLSPQRVS
jgi:DNA modification methylase